MFLNLRLGYGAAREIHETFSVVRVSRVRVRMTADEKGKLSDPGKSLCLHYPPATNGPRHYIDLEVRYRTAA